MKKLMTKLLFLLSIIPGIACASEDCMMVEFSDHVELVCTGDGVSISPSEQKMLQNRITTAAPVTTDTTEAVIVDKSKPETANAAEKVKAEDKVIVPKLLQIRLDRAQQTMERMRLQQLQRNSDPTLPTMKPSP